ncbi:hypothetical protein GWI33_005500 [Rhynchophorus ferrugineus]|uniref:Reverse transcriptase domain-containing protein n=1 Tax=Rhynchophorus ferrugineus TaxID=354439 RepID=A0A834IGF9_RHYFE|nr:hypothetical protein GWI33_005500 [Rhynchophorus ferrugineus]
MQSTSEVCTNIHNTENTKPNGNNIVINESHSIKRPVTPAFLLNYLVSPQSLKTIIGKLQTKKSPGFDRISLTQLKKLPHKQLAELAKIIMRLKHFPTSWKHAHIAVMPKRGLKSLTTGPSPFSVPFRIFWRGQYSMLSQRKTTSFLKNNLAFVLTTHSSVHQATHLTTHNHHALDQRKKLRAVLLDLNKAFNEVWHDILVEKCVRLGLPKDLSPFITSYLSDKYFQVKIRKTLSSRKQIDAGICREKMCSRYDVAFYADDTTFFTTARFIVTIHERLQKQLDHVMIMIMWLSGSNSGGCKSTP